MTTTAQITPKLSTQALKASNGIEATRLEKAIDKVLATFEAIAGAGKGELADVLAENRVTVQKVSCWFEGPRDSLITNSGFEYCLHDYQDPKAPLDDRERMSMSGVLEEPLAKIASGFGRIHVTTRGNDQLLVTFVTGKVPPGFFRVSSRG